MNEHEVLVRGDGAVGRALALALAAQGLKVALLGAESAPRRDDIRCFALNKASVALLTELKVWDALPEDARCPVYDMVVRGDAAGAQLDFSAWQQSQAQLAWIVDAAALEQQLAGAVRYSPHIELVTRPVPAALEAICEGRGAAAAAARAAHGVGFELHPYEQMGLAARLTADTPHQGVAQQWFLAPEVLALLPFSRPQAEHSYGLVWSVSPERACALQDCSEAEFEAELHQATGAAAGTLKLASPRAAWPLALGRASSFSGEGFALLGDAAHLVHPLAGQGLNLGFADVAALAQVLREREAWRPLGDARLLRRYARARLADTVAMGELTDGLQRLFATEQPALKMLRNQGLSMLNHLTPLKRWLTARALGN